MSQVCVGWMSDETSIRDGVGLFVAGQATKAIKGSELLKPAAAGFNNSDPLNHRRSTTLTP